MSKKFLGGIECDGGGSASGLKFTRINSSSTPDNTALPIGVDASGNVVPTNVANGVLKVIHNVDVSPLSANTETTFDVTVTGAAIGDPVVVNPPPAFPAYVIYTAWVQAADTVRVQLRNISAYIDQPAQDWVISVIKDAAVGGGGGGTPAGSTGTIQYNNAGAFAGVGNVQNFEGNLTFVAYDGTSPSTPAASVLFNKKLGNRQMLGQLGPSGIDYSFQPFFARNKIAVWMPAGNATTVPAIFGMSAFTALGTATARNVATTNFTTRQKRLGYVSAATAAAFAAVRLPAAQFTTGAGGTPALGGFMLVVRFCTSDAATVAGARQFVGMSNSTAAPTNVEPSTLTQCCGIGHGAADTNLKLFYGAAAAQTPIDLGANFPANTLSVDTYELILFAPPNVTNRINYEVNRLNTGHRATGSLVANVPAATTLLGFQAWRTNNATLLAVGLDICSFYLETDN